MDLEYLQKENLKLKAQVKDLEDKFITARIRYLNLEGDNFKLEAIVKMWTRYAEIVCEGMPEARANDAFALAIELTREYYAR